MNLLTGFFNGNMRFEGREKQILDDVKPDTCIRRFQSDDFANVNILYSSNNYVVILHNLFPINSILKITECFL